MYKFIYAGVYVIAVAVIMLDMFVWRLYGG